MIQLYAMFGIVLFHPPSEWKSHGYRMDKVCKLLILHRTHGTPSQWHEEVKAGIYD